jgi:hypothetical protein
MKKIDIFVGLENFFFCSFYPLLFFALLGIFKILDGLYFKDFLLLIRAVIFIIGVFFGATFSYVLTTVILDRFFSRYCKIMEETVNKNQELADGPNTG